MQQPQKKKQDNPLKVEVDKKALLAELARREHSSFLEYCWSLGDGFVSGRHIEITCARLDKALQDFKNGISTFLAIKWPFRHSKSTTVSCYLPPKFVAENPGKDVIITAYSFELVRTFSRFSRSIMRSVEYSEVYPETKLSKDSQSIERWGVCGKKEDLTEEDLEKEVEGSVFWAGIGGSMTGRGGSMIIMDDFFKGRQEAESKTIRNKVWDNLTNDIMTRRAPVCIFIILATPWHVDDPFGRIEKAMKEDPKFPKFEELKFPAFSNTYPSGTLWPERFSVDWYEGQKATLMPYGTASLLQCNPVLRGGNQLRVDKVKYYDERPEDVIFTRGWDLASSEKQRMSDDPDYTAGVLVGVKWLESGIPEHPIPQIYIDDVVHGRWEAPARDKIIQATAIADGFITQAIESFGAYKDAYNHIKSVLAGIRTVKPLQLPGDKAAKYQVLEAPFEAGNVYLKRGAPWVQGLLEELGSVPSTAHDDRCDALAVAYSAHEPYNRRVLVKAEDAKTDPGFVVDFKNMSPYSRLICSIWVAKDLSTAVLYMLWNPVLVKLWVFGELVLEHPRPDGFLVKSAKYLKDISDKTVTNLNKFDIYGNSIMHSPIEKDPTNDMATGYQKYNLWVRENDFYEEGGAIVLAARLMQRGGLRIHPRCERLKLETVSWTSGEGKPEDGFNFARALCNGVSICSEETRLAPPPKKVHRFSPESQDIKKRLDAIMKTDPDSFDYMTDEEVEDHKTKETSMSWMS